MVDTELPLEPAKPGESYEDLRKRIGRITRSGSKVPIPGHTKPPFNSVLSSLQHMNKALVLEIRRETNMVIPGQIKI